MYLLGSLRWSHLWWTLFKCHPLGPARASSPALYNHKDLRVNLFMPCAQSAHGTAASCEGGRPSSANFSLGAPTCPGTHRGGRKEVSEALVVLTSMATRDRHSDLVICVLLLYRRCYAIGDEHRLSNRRFPGSFWERRVRNNGGGTSAGPRTRLVLVSYLCTSSVVPVQSPKRSRGACLKTRFRRTHSRTLCRSRAPPRSTSVRPAELTTKSLPTQRHRSAGC